MRFTVAGFCADEEQGVDEARSEVYATYTERVLEATTQLFAVQKFAKR